MTPAVTDTTVEAVSHLNTSLRPRTTRAFSNTDRWLLFYTQDTSEGFETEHCFCWCSVWWTAAVLPCSPWCVWYRTLCCWSCCLETGCCLQGPPHRLCGRRDIYTHCYTRAHIYAANRKNLDLCSSLQRCYTTFSSVSATLHLLKDSTQGAKYNVFVHKLIEHSNVTRHSKDFHISALILCPDWTEKQREILYLSLFMSLSTSSLHLSDYLKMYWKLFW